MALFRCIFFVFVSFLSEWTVVPLSFFVLLRFFLVIIGIDISISFFMDSIFEIDVKWFEMEDGEIRLDFCVDFLILGLIRSRYRHNYVRMHSFAS